MPITDGQLANFLVTRLMLILVTDDVISLIDIILMTALCQLAPVKMSRSEFLMRPQGVCWSGNETSYMHTLCTLHVA